MYFAAGRLGLSLAFVPGVSLVWPPTGIALAALLLWGSRMWPAVALGAFLVNLTTVGHAAAAAGVVTGNTLEAVVGALLLRRVAGFENSLTRLKDVVGLAVCAALGSTAISATVGTLSICAAGILPWDSYGTAWGGWWLGDAMGALVSLRCC